MEMKITKEEKECFDTMYEILAPNFPKTCGCGRTFKNELEYSLSTTSLGGATDYRAAGMGFLFFRNHIYKSNERRNISEGDFHELKSDDCLTDDLSRDEICGSTLALVVGRADDAHKLSGLMSYVQARAKEECVDEAVVMSKVREDYNTYLVARDLHTLL
jgi:hypothetical protein